MKNLIKTLIYPLFLMGFLLVLISNCEKDSEDQEQINIKSGIWNGTYDDNLAVSIIVENNMIVRADVVFKLSDGYYDRATLKNVSFGPFYGGSNSSFVIETDGVVLIETDGMVDYKIVCVTVNVNLEFETATKVTGHVTIWEDDEGLGTYGFELNWEEEIPTSGHIRDGEWTGAIDSPIFVYFHFNTIDGAVSTISFIWMDASSFSFGTIYRSSTINIGDDFNFSLYANIDVELQFTGYMEGSGDIMLDLTSGDVIVPVDVDWHLAYPDDKKKAASMDEERNQLFNKYNSIKESYFDGCLKNKTD